MARLKWIVSGAVLVAAAFMVVWAQPGICDDATGAPDEEAELFFKAASSGDLATLHELLGKHPALVHARAKDDKTAVHRAAMVGKTESIKVLLNAGADVKARDTHRKTPYYYARIGHFRDTAKYIKYRGGAD